MEYMLLTQEQRDQVSLRKLLDLEAAHYGLELEVKIALSTGVRDDSVITAQQQVVLLARQISLLCSWIRPAEEEDVETPVPNGQDPVEVE